MGAPSAAAGTDDSQGYQTGYGTKAYRTYVLNALLLVYILNFLDRQLIGIVSEPIMNDLQITDGSFGLLTGIGFALLYSIVGIPLAHFSETRSRVVIMGVCIALWSAATAGSGLAQEIDLGFLTISGFAFLFIMRVLVGIGEAGCTPPANSLIADYYPPARRSTALGYYAMGVTAGTLMANLVGGQIAEAFDWRTAFYAVGIAGVGIAILFALTVKEPPRGYSDPPGTVRPERASFSAALRELTSKKSFWLMAAGATMAAFCGYGISTFQTSFLIRTHGLSIGDATLMINVPVAFASSVGVALTGWIAEKSVKRHPNAIAWIPAIGLALSIPFYVLAFWTSNLMIALVGLCIGGLVKYGYLAAQYTIGQGVVSMRVRATATAILLFIINLIGYGLGPWFIGIVSEVFFTMQANADGFVDLARTSCKGDALAQLPTASQDFCNLADARALQYSLIVTSVIYVVPALFFMLCSKTLSKDMVAR